MTWLPEIVEKDFRTQSYSVTSKQLKRVVPKIKEQWQINTSKKTIQRILKSLKMSWLRMRRGIAGQPQPIMKKKTDQLQELKRLEERGEISLYYLEETGFSLVPNVPYGWQNQSEYLTIEWYYS